MRILIYTHAFPPMIGGIETITMQLARGLALHRSHDVHADEVEVSVVTPGATRSENENALPFQVVRRPGLAQLARLIRRTDILHIAGPNMLPLLLGWFFRKQMVVEHHGFQTACPSGQLVYQPDPSPCPGHFMARRYASCLKCNAHHGVMQSFKQWCLTFVRRWLCSAASANVMPTAWLGTILQLPKLVTIHHGLPAPKVLRQVPQPDSSSVVFQGRLVSTKGVSTLLHAAHLISDRDFKVKIIGDGPERARLEAEAKTLGLSDRVEFLGYLSSEQAEKIMAQARAIVMPSLGGEVFGLVALENMHRAKAVIVSAIGALAEVVGDERLIFPPGDAKALAACLRRVFETDGFAEEAGALASNRAGSLFSVDRMVSEHVKLYQRLKPVGLGRERVAQVA